VGALYQRDLADCDCRRGFSNGQGTGELLIVGEGDRTRFHVSEAGLDAPNRAARRLTKLRSTKTLCQGQ
jgi:hypothetical protein